MEIVRTLLRHLPEGVPAGRLAESVGCAPSTLSFHLQHLASASLVAAARRKQSVVYFAVPQAIGDLTAFLTSECCGGRPRLCPPVSEGPSGCDEILAGQPDAIRHRDG